MLTDIRTNVRTDRQLYRDARTLLIRRRGKRGRAERVAEFRPRPGKGDPGRQTEDISSVS